MDKINIYINTIIKVLKSVLFKLYYKIIFLSNKQTTIKKMYEPRIQDKIINNQELNNTLKKLRNENKELLKDIEALNYENKALEIKINIINDYILKKY